MAFDIRTAKKPFDIKTAIKAVDQTQDNNEKKVPPINTSEFWTGMAGNIPESALQTVQPILHPIRTVKAIGTLTKDLASNMGKDLLGIKHIDKNTADILGEVLRDRYGSLENLKKTLYTDPVGLAMDASMIVNPSLKLAGGLTKKGKLGIPSSRISKVVNNVEKLGNPAFATERAITVLPRVAFKFARKDLAGVTDITHKNIKRLGPERVFDPLKAKVDYIGHVVVPKIQKKVALQVKTLDPEMNNTLRNLGLSHDDVQIIKKLSPQKRNMIGDIVEGKIDDVMGIIKQEKDIASNFFRETLDSIPDNTYLKIDNTINNLRNELEKIGWAKITASPIISRMAKSLGRDNIVLRAKEIKGASIPNKAKKNLLKIYNNLQSREISPTEYYNTLSELDASISGVPSFDRIIRQTQKNLRNDVVSNIPQLKEANRVYAEASKVEDIAKSLEKLSEGNVKLPLANSIETKLNNLRTTGKYNARKQWKKLVGKDLFDDVLAHWSNMDFNLISSIPGQGGAFYPTIGKFIQLGASQGSKSYYKNIYPYTKDLPKTTPGLYQMLYQAGKIKEEGK